jgi:hypothetical protein
MAGTPASFLSIAFPVRYEWWPYLFHPSSSPHMKIFTNITTLRSPCWTDSLHFMDDFPPWLSLFPNLNTLDIVPRCLTSDEYKLAIVEKIIAQYPHIQVMTCDGTGGTIEDWRSGKQHYLPSISDDMNWDEE